MSNITPNVRQIYERGQTVGNRPNVFSKIGDSITVSKSFLYSFGLGQYALNEYGYLQPVIERFAGGYARTENAFANESLAAGVGWTSFHILSLEYTDLMACLPDEVPLVCEYRIVKPSVALIMFGTNDVGILSAEDYRANLAQIVQISLEMGVIPVLSTMPPRQDFDLQVNQFNGIVRQIAANYQVPLMDYYSPMLRLPNRGLGGDGVHPSAPPGNFAESAFFTPQNLQYGYTLRNLTALQALDLLLKWVD